MNPADPQFLAWAKRFGYVPWRPFTGHEREKFARHWLAWQANMPPDCKLAHSVVRLSGVLSC